MKWMELIEWFQQLIDLGDVVNSSQVYKAKKGKWKYMVACTVQCTYHIFVSVKTSKSLKLSSWKKNDLSFERLNLFKLENIKMEFLDQANIKWTDVLSNFKFQKFLILWDYFPTTNSDLASQFKLIIGIHNCNFFCLYLFLYSI